MWKTLLITCGFIYNTTMRSFEEGISTGLFKGNISLFNSFLLKKDINLLILHRNTELWINKLNDS